MQNFDNSASDAFPDGVGDGETSPCESQDSSVSEVPSDRVGETEARRRRRERIALVQEFGGHCADIKKAAVEAIRRGMYSPRTSRGDVELCLLRTWKLRNRDYDR